MIRKILIFIFLLSFISCATSPFKASVRIYYQQQIYEKLLSESKRWVKEEPKNPEAHLWLGLAYTLQNDYLNAADAFEKAFSVDTTTFDTSKVKEYFKTAGGVVFDHRGIVLTLRNALVKLLQENRDLQKAKSYADLIIRLDPYLPETYLLKSLTLQLLGDQNFHVPLEEGLKFLPNDTLLTYKYAILLIERKNFKNAYDYLIKIRPNYDEHHEYHYYLGVVYFEMDSVKQAQEEFKRAVTLDSLNSDYQFNLALTSYRVKEHNQAREAFKKYTELKPDDPQGFYFLAILSLETKKNLEEGLESINKAIELVPENPDYMGVKALILKELGRTQEALIYFKKAEELLKNRK